MDHCSDQETKRLRVEQHLFFYVMCTAHHVNLIVLL
jgi:hypothetical protein